METFDSSQIYYFSEHGEDYLLRCLLGCKNEGFYIDVGAFDGKYLSDSYSFSLSGWEGVCVEPVKEYAELCRTRQPNAICIHAACVSDPAISETEFHAEPSGLHSRITCESEDERLAQDVYARLGVEFPGMEKLKTPATTLNKIIETHAKERKIDFISIDACGDELLVLQGLDLNRHQPDIISVNSKMKPSQESVKDHLERRQYQLIRSSGYTHLFSNNPEIAARAAGNPIRCAIERQTHPRGIEYTPAIIARGKPIDEGLQFSPQDQRRLNRKVETLEARCQELQKQLAGQGIDPTTHQRILLRNQELESRHDELLRAVARDRKTLEENNDYVKNVESAEYKLRTENISLQNTVYELKQSVAKKESELASCRQTISAMQARAARLSLRSIWPFQPRRKK